MYRLFVLIMLSTVFLQVYSPGSRAEEMYILTAKDGSEIIVKDFKFTDEYVEFTTDEDLPGFMKKENLAEISNMVGVSPLPPEELQTVEKIEQRKLMIWIGTVAVMIILYLFFLLYVIRRKKGGKRNVNNVSPGRVEKKTKTQGHLAFRYMERSGRQTDWVIEVCQAYEEKGILFVEGISTSSEKRKTFRADRIVNPVQDMSSGHRYSVENLFTDADST